MRRGANLWYGAADDSLLPLGAHTFRVAMLASSPHLDFLRVQEQCQRMPAAFPRLCLVAF